MKVLKGFSEEIAHCQWAKVDVELDSQDLVEICEFEGLDPSELTHRQKYAILSSEAERLLTVEFIRTVQAKAPGQYDMDSLKTRLDAVSASYSKAIESASGRTEV